MTLGAHHRRRTFVVLICGVAAWLSNGCSGSGTADGTSSTSTGSGAPRPKGAPCTDDAACTSGSCVDGVCCDSACAGACQACSAALNGGTDGTCAAAIDGSKDPRGLCVTTAVATCGTDGTCHDGACEKWPADTVCAAPSCDGGIQSTGGPCDGAGKCTSVSTFCGDGGCCGTTCCVPPLCLASCSGNTFCWLDACASVTAIDAGGDFTCTLLTSGGAQCWGYNSDGELGNGTQGDHRVPVGVFGLSSGLSAIATGFQHACALDAMGGVRCWGNNLTGELGDGSTMTSLVPIGVSGLSSGVAALSLGAFHTCALTTGGKVECWGAGDVGQLGNNSTMDSHVPIAVPGLSSGVTTVAAGSNHTCVRITGGAVKCWGRNDRGQVGNGSTTNSLVPVAVSGLSSGVVAIAGGTLHSCAVTATGGVVCWGANDHGELGDASTSDSHIPVAVSGLSSGVASIGAGYTHTCALTTSGAVECWGQNDAGQLGNDSTTGSLVPVPVSGLTSGVAAIAVGSRHNCALTTAGTVSCWGENIYGQLGNGTTMNSLVPVGIVEP